MLLRKQMLSKALCLQELFGGEEGHPCSDSSRGNSTIGEQGRSPDNSLDFCACSNSAGLNKVVLLRGSRFSLFSVDFLMGFEINSGSYSQPVELD